MKYEDLSFTMINKDGLEVICDITAVVPNTENSDEPYVVFTDYTLDENGNFVDHYGKIIMIDGDCILKNIEDEKIINKIKEEMKDEVVSYVNSQIQANLD